MSHLVDRCGHKYRRLTVVSRAESNKWKTTRWNCLCSCGKTTVVSGGDLHSGRISSCGCLLQESLIKHGFCGINVCPRWLNSFENFFSDMGYRPSKKHSIDRIDNNGNYEPENCRWATSKEQARNTRSNNLFEYNGESKCLSQWAEDFGISYKMLHLRLTRRNWSLEKALTTPPLCSRQREFTNPNDPGDIGKGCGD
jgi:hypothetical protein